MPGSSPGMTSAFVSPPLLHFRILGRGARLKSASHTHRIQFSNSFFFEDTASRSSPRMRASFAVNVLPSRNEIRGRRECRAPAAPAIDDTCDVVHGHEQLSLFNAHYDDRCFLPIHVYDTEKSRPVAVVLRPGKTPGGVEVRAHLRRLVRH